MYIPPHFQEKDLDEITSLIREFSFALLVSVSGSGPCATHLPLELVIDETGRWRLFGHIARANPQWMHFKDRPEVLVVFSGPHTYVSPSWYGHPNVPTWNYKAVHLSGTARILDGVELESTLRRMMHHYESAHAEAPRKYDDLPGDLLDQDIKGIVGIEISVDKIEAASKLSQNRNAQDYQSVVANLKEMDDYDAQRIALEMEKRKSI